MESGHDHCPFISKLTAVNVQHPSSEAKFDSSSQLVYLYMLTGLWHGVLTAQTAKNAGEMIARKVNLNPC